MSDETLEQIATQRKLIHDQIRALFKLRDMCDDELRLALGKAGKNKLEIGSKGVKLIADGSPRLRRCRRVVGADGTVKLLQPGCATKLVVYEVI